MWLSGGIKSYHGDMYYHMRAQKKEKVSSAPENGKCFVEGIPGCLGQQDHHIWCVKTNLWSPHKTVAMQWTTYSDSRKDKCATEPLSPLSSDYAIQI